MILIDFLVGFATLSAIIISIGFTIAIIASFVASSFFGTILLLIVIICVPLSLFNDAVSVGKDIRLGMLSKIRK